jgi:hypothetical protein
VNTLPRVSDFTRERIAREFDNLGPDACVAEITEHLRDGNPELLDMALKCARDVGDPRQIMVGFTMLYRLLVAQCFAQSPDVPAAMLLDPLPRITPETRERIATQIAQQGSDKFTRSALDDLERNNPGLLQMAHHFASRQAQYLAVMQGFALLYASLVAQAASDRASPH